MNPDAQRALDAGERVAVDDPTSTAGTRSDCRRVETMRARFFRRSADGRLCGRLYQI